MSDKIDPRLDRRIQFDPKSKDYPIRSIVGSDHTNLRSYSWKCESWLDQGREGACHDAATEVLTEVGWQKWSDYDPSKLLATVNPATQELEYQAPLGLTRYDYDGPVYYSKNQSLDFALTPGHRMYQRRWDQKLKTLSDDYSFLPIEDCGWYFGLQAAPSRFRGIHLEKLSLGLRKYTGDDFVALIALIVSDGWAGGTENTKNRVSFCCFREDRLEKVQSLAHRLGLTPFPYRPNVWCWSDPELAEWVKSTCYTDPTLGSGHKRIPQFIKSLGTEQLKVFLSFFGDQGKDGRQFYSSSKQLAEDIQEILLKVGLRSSINYRTARDSILNGREIKKENCSGEYVVTVRTAGKLSIDRKEHLEQDYYKGEVFCATVSNSTLITRRNGSTLISGNCVGFGWSHDLSARPATVDNVTDDTALKIYKLAQTLDDYPGENYSGTSVLAGVKAVQQLYPGVIPEYRWAFNLMDVLLTIGYHSPVVLGIAWYNDMYTPDKNGIIKVSGMQVGGHCILATAYNKNTGLVKLHNSWGKDWGINGECFITTDDLQRLLNEEGEACVPMKKRVR